MHGRRVRVVTSMLLLLPSIFRRLSRKQAEPMGLGQLRGIRRVVIVVVGCRRVVVMDVGVSGGTAPARGRRVVVVLVVPAAVAVVA